MSRDQRRPSGILILGFLVLVVLPLGLRADGGTLRVANAPVGAYRVNVFTAPTPIPPDTIDVSVLVTSGKERSVAEGLTIQVRARRLDGAVPEVHHDATREQATDPRYYAANFALGSVGKWEITVAVSGPEGDGEVSFQVAVKEPGLLQNPLLLLGAALVPLALVGWWLRSSSRSSRPEG